MDVIGRDFDDLGRMLARRESRRSVFRSSLRAGTQPLTRPLDGIRMDALSRALDVYGTPRVWRRLQGVGMTQDHSWHRSAREYVTMYKKLQRLGTRG